MGIDDKLKQLVEREAAEIAAAPVVQSAGTVSRCHFCGQLAPGGSEARGPMPSDGGPQITYWRGGCCGG